MFRHLRWGGQQDSCCYEIDDEKLRLAIFRVTTCLPQILTNQACSQHPFPISSRRLNKCWRSEATPNLRASLPQRGASPRKAVGRESTVPARRSRSPSVWPPAKPFFRRAHSTQAARPGWRAQLVDGRDRVEPRFHCIQDKVPLILD